MLRRLHGWLGLALAIFVLMLALTGSMLSLKPTLQRAVAIVPARGNLSVAQVTATVQARYQTPQQIERLATGALLVYSADSGVVAADIIDPYTGATLASYQPSAFWRWLKSLHRAWLWDERGSAVVGLTAVFMVFLLLSGMWLLTTRAGGWRRLFAVLQHSATEGVLPRLHAEVGRVVAIALFFSALSGVFLSAIRFNLLTGPAELTAEFPSDIGLGQPMAIAQLPALQQIDLVDLHQLTFPAAGDLRPVITLRTHQGAGYIDPSTGLWLSYAQYAQSAKFATFIKELHTGEALWWFGLLLGICSLGVPVLVYSGVMIWWQRQTGVATVAGNVATNLADTIVLVGSETNSTWGFALSLNTAFSQVGCKVHLAPMNQLAKAYPKARRLFILTATYGDGDAPASATEFLTRLSQIPSAAVLPFAVLGFGDHQFTRYCAFAHKVEQQLLNKHWPQLMATQYIDRQSILAFERWGAALGAAIALPVKLSYQAFPQQTRQFSLVAREELGQAVHAPTVILGFKAASGAKLPKFNAGDLIGIVPKGSLLPRFYSLASSSRSGLLEICVRVQPDGLCSGQLFALVIGDIIDGFIQLNPRFKPRQGRSALILIGAGTGIAPLIGFIRANSAGRPVYLYWGGRLASADFLYHDELILCLTDGRLTQLSAAFSRAVEPAYVQDKVLHDAELIRQLMLADAQILVCGARQMAIAVEATLNSILAPIALNVGTLQKSARYLEDSY